MNDLLTQSVRDIAALSALISQELNGWFPPGPEYAAWETFCEKHDGASGVAYKVAETAHELYNRMDGLMQLSEGCDYYVATAEAAHRLYQGDSAEESARHGHLAGVADVEENGYVPQ